MKTAEDEEELKAGAHRQEQKDGSAREDIQPSTEKAGRESPPDLDKVRDILFGSQSREYEKRLSALEDTLILKASELQNDLRTRFESLESYIRKEVESLTGRIKVEHDERADSIKELMREFRDSGKTMEKKVAHLDEQTTKEHRDLRQRILDQHKTLSNEIQEKHGALTQTFRQTVQELRDEKVNRTLLADLLAKTALCLSDDIKIPKDK
jgi:hypothetical protein